MPSMTLDNFEDSIQVTSTGVVAIGDPLYNSSTGDILGFAATNATASGQLVTYRVWGQIDGVPKSTADQWFAGSRIYWDSVNSNFTRTPTPYKAGFASAAVAAATTSGNVILVPEGSRYWYRIAAASSAVTNTTTQTVFSNGTYSIGANLLTVGSRIRVRARATVTGVTATPTGVIALLIGGTQQIACSATTVAANNIAMLDVDITVRTVGSGGTMIGSGTTTIGASGTAAPVSQSFASATLNTTIANAVAVAWTWSAASASNTVILDEMVIERAD